MRKAEQNLWASLKRNAPAHLWMQRIENVMVPGMPDVYVAGREQCWIELKAPKAKAHATTPLMRGDGLNAYQINWMIKAHRSNVRAFILIRDSEMNLSLIHAALAAEVNMMSREQLDDVSLASNWPMIFNVIT